VFSSHAMTRRANDSLYGPCPVLYFVSGLVEWFQV